ncbi:ATP-binding protein [Streptomyces mirabilis]|uniref:ATP-binding protein n=1 Tax=Streptomyces mirabilis TaxID=68239 RepID=UPI00381AA5B8
MESNSIGLARIHTRTQLALMSWRGDQDDAVVVVHVLVENVLKHVAPHCEGIVELGLTVTEDEELLVDVTDPDPTFDGFSQAAAAQSVTGLGALRALDGEITLSIPEDAKTKTVRVRLEPKPVSPLLLPARPLR